MLLPAGGKDKPAQAAFMLGISRLDFAKPADKK